MKRRRWMVCAAALCMVLACSGCRDKADDSTGTNVSVIEGDDVKEYSSGSDAPTVNETTEATTENDDSVSGIARTLGIP